ncbi:MAG: hypothetical protein LBC95_02400 [Candidatus Nomurabacteria bacterium]|nr:hypothetical protein [Candidatus Nomurabacteria bacterium]
MKETSPKVAKLEGEANAKQLDVNCDCSELDDLANKYDALQLKYGDPELKSIYFGGETNKPKLMLIFMNPTGANIASRPDWHGIRAPWIGTKNIWKLLCEAELLSKEIYDEIRSKRAPDWSEDFAGRVYDEVRRNGVFITNLGKCTQADVRSLPDGVFREYLGLLRQEIEIVQPRIIVAFGNQVSSVLLEKGNKVSESRLRRHELKVSGKTYPVYATFYPVGQGMRNIDKSIEGLGKIAKEIEL